MIPIGGGFRSSWKRPPFFLRVVRHKEEIEMKKIDIASLPELATSVGIHGSMKQKEVGGAVCIGVLIGIAVWSDPGNP
jgi:hypothetical protein